MYEKDAEGKVKRDRDGRPVFDSTSEKGKLFNEIAGADPTILRVATGAKIVMEAVENRLKGVSENKVKADLEIKKKAEEDARQARVAAGQVADGGDGGNAPEDDKIEIVYSSEEEKAHVARAISKGQFKDAKEYMKVKKSNVIPYGRGGF
jgi:hypothetical protein